METVASDQGMLHYFLSLKGLFPFLETAKSSLPAPRVYKVILNHKSVSIPLDHIVPRRNGHILCLCFLEKSLKREGDNITFFSQESVHLRAYNILSRRTLG